MLKKMLSMLLVVLMLMSLSVSLVSARKNTSVADAVVPVSDKIATDDETSTGDEISSFDEAYAYLVGVIEATEGINESYYTDESLKAYLTAKSDAGMAHINAFEDMYTAEELILFADELLKAYEALEYLIFGDTDGDGKVNIKDATEIQKYLADIVTLSEKRLMCGDINRDGENNIKDVTLLQKFLAGLTMQNDVKYIELDFYIIHLKTELLELMEYGEAFVEGKKFEAESYERYLIANGKASSAYSDKWPFAEDAQEVLDAITELKTALNGLATADEIPNPPDNGDIVFKDAYEFRVSAYDYNTEPVNMIINSPEELQAVIDKIEYYYSVEDIFPEEYNDAFFEDNAVVVSLFVVGGSGCSQRIHTLTVDGTALTLYRTVTRPELYPTDINYVLAYLEVKKTDIAAVDMIINETNYVTVGGGSDW